MLDYSGLNEKTKFSKDEKTRIASGLLNLREAFASEKDGVPKRVRSGKLLLATWNISNFDYNKTRLPESLFYISEIIDHFDIVAVQEIVDDLSALEDVMKILGDWWRYIITDISADGERSAILYDTRKVKFGGFTGQILSREATAKKPSVKLRRIPFMVGFSSGWFDFIVCTMHAYWGDSNPNNQERFEEINYVANELNEYLHHKHPWAPNIILLGDFNIYTIDSSPMKALSENNFKLYSKLLEVGTSTDQKRHFDQIAFLSKDVNDQLESDDIKCGVFNYYQSVFKPDQEDKYRQYYGTKDYNGWRKSQMSDHLPMWIELTVDFSEKDLRKIINNEEVFIRKPRYGVWRKR